ncbi:MAG: redox-sensing transcriptional repressor Rex [Alphaproteobacteria bacterium]|nr:redox-sensing transcriptional repressor Rex [Alphaproteobacteria bacterium]
MLSDKVIERLSLYHCILQDCLNAGEEFISSAQIALLLKVDDSQVRKDIALCAVQGRAKIGYNALDLKLAIEHLLGFKNNKRIFIVGAGNLGFALSKYDDFKDYGLDVVALFDNDPLKFGMKVNNKEVYDIQKLPKLSEQMGVETVILTVPRSKAQEVTDFLVKSNIHYIWNFTQSVLKVPPNVSVHYENLISHFLLLKN